MKNEGFEVKTDVRGIRFFKEVPEGTLTSFVQIYESGEYHFTSFGVFVGVFVGVFADSVERFFAELFEKDQVTVEATVRYQNLNVNRAIGELMERGSTISDVINAFKDFFTETLYLKAKDLFDIANIRESILSGKGGSDNVEVSAPEFRKR